MLQNPPKKSKPLAKPNTDELAIVAARPVRDAVKIARHFSAVTRKGRKDSPVGTTEEGMRIPWYYALSAVPTGLDFVYLRWSRH